MPDSYISSSYFYSSTTNSSDGTTTTGHQYSTSSRTDRDGSTTVRTAHQDLGQPAVVEERRYDHTGQEQIEIPGPEGTSAGGVRRITDIEDEGSTGVSTEDAGSAHGSEAATQFISDDVVDRGSYDLGMTPFGDRIYNPALGTYDQRSGSGAGAGTRHPRLRRDFEKDTSEPADTRARDDAFVTEEL
ncbi:hypothetical protein N7492_006644 [Penicillium capsulatum]|uniref:Uncharacterized protein n=1 Tax=Penicillium capsulatum TaxID=69766 RepID=A0A9W9LK00_9EURO|nr:hypothetical protein N7492_006644 [Penicillium capsulatum]KAJ6116479.1 hypothetical protein N7512_006204 [Penicillium capsulatum]